MVKTTDGEEIKKGEYCYTKEGTQAVLVDYAVMSGEPKYMINLFYEGETFYGDFHQYYTVEADVPYEIEDEERPILVGSVFAKPPTQKICKEIKQKNIEIQDKRNELSLVNKDFKCSLDRLNKIKKVCVNLYKQLDPLKAEYMQLKSDLTRIRDKKYHAEGELWEIKNDIEAKRDYYTSLSDAVLHFKMGNKDLEQIPESSELVELRKRDRILSALEAGGVDNWEWYSESLKNMEED